jgi:flagellar biogenesis protein FliO
MIMKKILLTLSLTFTSGLVFAQDAMKGMKNEAITSSPTAGATSATPPLLQLGILVTVMFLVVKFVMPKLLNKVSNRISTPLDSSIRVEESATIGQGGLYVVSVRGRTYFVGASPTSISCLADLTEADRQEREVPAFFEILDNSESFEANDPDIDEATRRLRRLLEGNDAA